MLYIQYSEQTHMYVDTQTRTPTDVLADLIVRELYSQVRYAFLFESSTSSKTDRFVLAPSKDGLENGKCVASTPEF